LYNNLLANYNLCQSVLHIQRRNGLDATPMADLAE